MQLSKLTFSLASLVVLIAFGFVFGTTSVMAHPHFDLPDTANEDESDVDHSMSDHPAATITLTSANAEAFKDASIEGAEVRLVKADGSAFEVVAGTAPDADGIFKLRITFSQDLDTADVLSAGGITLAAIGKTNPNIDASLWIRSPGPGFIADDAATTTVDESMRVFDVTITVPRAMYAELPITIFASVHDEDSAGVTSIPRVNPTTGELIPALPNLESTPTDAKFSIVASFGPTAGTKITVAPGAAIKSVESGSGEVGPSATSATLTLTAEKAVSNIAAAVKVTNSARFDPTGTANQWTMTIVVDIATTDVKVTAAAGYELHQDDPDTPAADPKKIDSGFVITVDRVGPKLKSVVAPDTLPVAGGPFYVTITFDEPLAATPAVADFDVKNGTISDIRPVSSKQYTATITPADGIPAPAAAATATAAEIAAVAAKQNVEVRLKAGLADEHGNASVATAATATTAAQGVFALSPVKATTGTPSTGPAGPAIGDVVLAAKGDATDKDYAVLVHTGATAAQTGIASSVTTIPVDMGNLYEFFRDSGTLTLMGPAGATAGSVKITEIMWGTDASLSNPMMSQWIEIQNTTAAADATTADATAAAATAAEVTVNFGSTGGWSLEFKPLEYAPSPTAVSATVAGAVDHLSNLGNPGRWNVPGASGRTAATDTENQVELFSMLRDLGKNAHKAGAWAESERPSINLDGARVGNPGAPKPPAIIASGASSVDRSTVYITEIGNFADGSDWLELYNSTDAAVNIKNWIISAATKAAVEGATDAELIVGNGSAIDKQMFSFGRATYEDALKIPAKSHLLVTASDPANSGNPLAVGINLKTTKADRDPKTNQTTGLKHLYYIESNLKISSDPHLLILRNHHEREGTGSNIRDMINIGDYLAGDVGAIIAGKWNTEIWPLQAAGKPGVGDREAVGTSGVISKEKTDKPWSHKETWGVPGFTGLGYDRDVSDSTNTKGTPGYAHGAVRGKLADLASDAHISISEIMVAHGDGRLPQWIELYNSSMTQAVGLNGWKLQVYNVDSEDVTLNDSINATVTLPDKKILPNQTVLIVSTTGRNSGRDHFPSHRIIDLWSGDAFGRSERLDPVISSTGFNITLIDPDKVVVDQIGNIDNNRRTNDMPAWELLDGMAEDGRSSLIRAYGTDKMNPRGEPGYDMAQDGTMSDAWTLASTTNLSFAHHDDPYYGRADDIATPGFRGGGPLPVSLSKFRPERA